VGKDKKAVSEVQGAKGAEIETVELCGCTNTKLERGETCGEPQCPNYAMHLGHALDVARKVTDLDYYEDKKRKGARRTRSEAFTNGDGKTVWRILDKNGKVLRDEIADEELMKTTVVMQRKVFREKTDLEGQSFAQ
jgi:hypothetical protein